MDKLYFGWDYYNYSKQPDINKVIRDKFQDFRPDRTYPNDSDTLPLFNDEYMVTNPWHQLLDILEDYEVVEHKDTTELIERDIPFIYLIGIRSGPQEWGIDNRNELFYNIKQHTKNYIKDGEEAHSDKVCPECNIGGLVYQDGCVTCASCGYAKCG